MNSSTEVVRTYNFAEASCINFASEILSESSAARPESSKKDELYIFFMRTSSPRLMSPSTKLNYSVDKYKVIRPLYASSPPLTLTFSHRYSRIFPFWASVTVRCFFCLVSSSERKIKKRGRGGDPRMFSNAPSPSNFSKIRATMLGSLKIEKVNLS